MLQRLSKSFTVRYSLSSCRHKHSGGEFLQFHICYWPLTSVSTLFCAVIIAVLLVISGYVVCAQYGLRYPHSVLGAAVD